MERNGGVAERLSRIKSTVTGTYIEDDSVQESLRNLLLLVIPAPTFPFLSLESEVLAPRSAHLSKSVFHGDTQGKLKRLKRCFKYFFLIWFKLISNMRVKNLLCGFRIRVADGPGCSGSFITWNMRFL